VFIGEVMKQIAILTFLVFIISCGVKLDVADSNQNVEFGPDFVGAANFCDERYEDDEAAEKCFLDYREYLNLKVGVDLSEIVDYCDANYNTEIEVIACEERLTSLLGGV